MRRLPLVLAVLSLAVLLAGCGSRGVTTPAPETVIGSLPKAAEEPATPAFELKGDPTAGAKVFQSAGCVGCHTLAAAHAVLRPRTAAAIAAVRAAGVHVIVVTGRMFRATLPYLEQAGLDDPVICYQGAVVADPGTGEFLRHVPIPRAVALEALDAVVNAGFHVNCYVDDVLYVAKVT